MSGHSKPLIGSVFERKPGPSAPAPSLPQANGSKTGFPTAQHRSKSVFARNRAQQQPAASSSRDTVPPVVQQASGTNDLLPAEELDTDDWRVQMSEENQRRVSAMAEEEREQERREIEERFGKNIGDVLRRARMARESQEKQKRAAASSEGNVTLSRPDGGSGISMPFVSPGSFRTFQSKCCMRGTDPLKAVDVVPTGTLSHLPFLLYT
jgi:RNA polymerase II-associated protein 1